MADWLGAGTSYPIGDGWILLPVDVQTTADLRAAVSNNTTATADTLAAISTLLTSAADTKAGASNGLQILTDLFAAVGNMVTAEAATTAAVSNEVQTVADLLTVVSNVVDAVGDTRITIKLATDPILILQLCIDSNRPGVAYKLSRPTATATSRQPHIKATVITGDPPCST